MQRIDLARDHNRKMSVKENQDFKRELEQERQRLLARNEKLKEIDRQMTAVMEERQQASRYNQEVAQYCRDNGLTITQYERQVFWADRDIGSYPAPEACNPDIPWSKGGETVMDNLQTLCSKCNLGKSDLE